MENGKKIAVIYKTKYGSTKRYAEWIADGAKADIFDSTQFDAAGMEGYSAIVFGSYVRAGKISGVNLIKDNWNAIKNKKIVVFTSTNAPVDDPGQRKVFEASLTGNILDNVKCFPLRGAFDYKNLDPADKFVMFFPKLMLHFMSIFGRNKQAGQYLKNFKTPQDYTSREAVEPIVSWLKQN